MPRRRADPTGRMEPAPLDLDRDAFRAAGHRLVDELAEFYASLRDRPVTPAEPVTRVRELLGTGALPAEGRPADELLAAITPLLCDHSLHNGHPRFFGYITSSAAPLGALADLLAAAVNANCGLWDLSPVASEIETQTIGWLAELVGYPTPCGGLMVSGGNTANLVGFLAARANRVPWSVREQGLRGDERQLTVYASRETHTWIEKAADVAGLGTAAIRWIAADAQQRIRVDALDAAIRRDIEAGLLPFLVVGTAGNVSTGAIDPLREIAAVARTHGLWLHVDGAYGAPAAVLPEQPPGLDALGLADSLALDPHKWLYSPIEAGCTLVREPDALRNTFSYRPPYYAAGAQDAAGLDYYEHGLQNTRGFRALKVWLLLRQAGRDGYARMIGDDVALARRLYEAADAHAELEACTHNLSITTLRYRPRDAASERDDWNAYLDELNDALVHALQKSGETYVSPAVVDGRRCLRACIVNFRTRVADIDALPDIVVRHGRELDAELRPRQL